MKTVFLSFLLSVVVVGAFGQNLIPNGSFEQETIMNRDSNCLKYEFPFWKSLNPDMGCGYYKAYFADFREYLAGYNEQLKNYMEQWAFDPSCKFFNRNLDSAGLKRHHLCFYKKQEGNETLTVALDTTFSAYKAYDGYCFLSSQTSFIRNLFSTKLSSPLIKDSTYCFEMVYRFPRYFSDDSSFFTRALFGVSFTHDEVLEKDVKSYANQSSFKPQVLIEKLDSNALEGWVRYTTTFKAEADYKYMIIGNHKPFNGVKQNSPISYHIDCLKLVERNQKGQMHHEQYQRENLD